MTVTNAAIAEFYGIHEASVGAVFGDGDMLRRACNRGEDHTDVFFLEQIAVLVHAVAGRLDRAAVVGLPAHEAELSSEIDDHPIFAQISHVRVCEACCGALGQFECLMPPDLSDRV